MRDIFSILTSMTPIDPSARALEFAIIVSFKTFYFLTHLIFGRDYPKQSAFQCVRHRTGVVWTHVLHQQHVVIGNYESE